MKSSHICILLTIHGTLDRVDEYKRAFQLWGKASSHFKKIVSVDSANNTFFKTTHKGAFWNRSPSLGEKMSILAAMPSLLDCPFVFKWTGRYYSHDFQKALASIPSNATLVLQSLKHTRGQNSEVFGATLDGMLQILSNVRLRPYTPMETALGRFADSTRATIHKLPKLQLAFPAEQKSRHRRMHYLR